MRAAVVLLVVLGLLSSATPALAGSRPVPTCNPAAEVALAQDAIGDHTSPVRWATRQAADAAGLAKAAAFSDATGVTLIEGIACRHLAFVTTHELAHQAQFRKYGSVAGAFRAYGDVELERVAQCVAEALGFPGYRAYGVGSWADCTDYEKHAAVALLG